MIKNAAIERSDSSAPTAEEMVLINKYTRRELKPEEVYVFSAILCDNEVDRDFERFTTQSLYTLEKLYLGKTGVIDHNPTAQNQTARIYSVGVEAVEGRKTVAGDGYMQLVAKAYLPRSESTAELILMLDSGIRKEISVGCAVEESVCSICGAKNGECSHQKGKSYGGKLCYFELCRPYDAYEWSFVAVPAQRNAGVIKRFSAAAHSAGEQDADKDCMQIIKSLGSEQLCLSASQGAQLAGYIGELEEKAADGESYRESLKAQVRKLALVCEPQIPSAVLESVIAKMSVDELCAYKKAYDARVKPQGIMTPSLAAAETAANADNHKFII